MQDRAVAARVARDRVETLRRQLDEARALERTLVAELDAATAADAYLDDDALRELEREIQAVEEMKSLFK
jgi:hypothetical protein